MDKNILFIDCPTKLSLENNHIIAIKGEEKFSYFVDDLAAIFFNNHQQSISLNLLSFLCKHKILTLFSDSRGFPQFTLLPFNDNAYCSGRLLDQINWKQPDLNKIWRKIVNNKISNQENTLLKLGLQTPDKKKYTIADGDKMNAEGLYAERYFKCLFGEKFKRGADDNINIALNYGYTILTSLICRIISAHGYNNQLGIYHQNIKNPYNLACDLMEVLRPTIDLIVYQNKDLEFGKEFKCRLIKVLFSKVKYENKEYNLMDAAENYVINTLKNINSVSKYKSIDL